MVSQEISINIKNLSKHYKLYRKPIDRLKEALNPFRDDYHQEFKAIDDISFEIKKGEIVGIIGKNGSGKSTLLKMLTGVLSPTVGSCEVNGRVAALLELGAGFNPELTGYENIFLNGSLMGYSRQEMLSRLDSIVEFADIGDFVNQPVKLYSSGMFVRLAFAVAISVDPDILIVDEALSVGDLRFQQKCIRKFKDFFDKGKTVIFVGHDIETINSFCSHCIWLNEGRVVAEGSPKVVTDDYISFMSHGLISSSGESIGVCDLKADWISTEMFRSYGESDAQITEIKISDVEGRAFNSLMGGERVCLKMKVDSSVFVGSPIFGFNLKNRLGANVTGGNTYLHKIPVGSIVPGVHCYQFEFNFPHLSNGDYLLTIAFADGSPRDHVQKCWIHDCFIFHVGNPDAKYSNGDGLVLSNGLVFRSIEVGS